MKVLVSIFLEILRHINIKTQMELIQPRTMEHQFLTPMVLESLVIEMGRQILPHYCLVQKANGKVGGITCKHHENQEPVNIRK